MAECACASLILTSITDVPGLVCVDPKYLNWCNYPFITMLVDCHSLMLLMIKQTASCKVVIFGERCSIKIFCIIFSRNTLNSTGDNVNSCQTNMNGNRSTSSSDALLSIIKRRNLSWFGHVCHRYKLSNTILQGIVEGSRYKRRRPHKL